MKERERQPVGSQWSNRKSPKLLLGMSDCSEACSAPIVLASVFLRSKLGGNGATTAPCVASGRNLPAPGAPNPCYEARRADCSWERAPRPKPCYGTPLAAGSSPRRRRVDITQPQWPWPEAKQHTHRTMCSIKGGVPRPERADSRLRGVFPCAQSSGTSDTPMAGCRGRPARRAARRLLLEACSAHPVWS